MSVRRLEARRAPRLQGRPPCGVKERRRPCLGASVRGIDDQAYQQTFIDAGGKTLLIRSALYDETAEGELRDVLASITIDE